MYFFYHIKSTPFPPGAKTEMCHFLPSGLKVPLSLPAPDRECCIFGLTRQKNRILTMGANKECLRSHVCQFTCDLGHSLLLLPRCVIYYYQVCLNIKYLVKEKIKKCIIKNYPNIIYIKSI